MSLLKRRTTYQYGTVTLEKRKKGPDAWVFRSTRIIDGKSTRPKVIVGTTEQYPTRADAVRASEHLRMAANAEAATHPSCTMNGLINRYIGEILRPCLDVPLGGEQDEAAPISFHCAKSYKPVLDKHVRPRWGTYDVRDFARPATRALVEQWLHSLSRSAKNPTGLAPKTVRSVFNAMKLVFKFGVKWGHLEQNPLSDKRVELPRGSTKRAKKPVQLSPSQFFTLLTLLGHLEKLAVAVAGWLGPRISEAFGLKWGDLDLDLGIVSFRRGFVQGRLTPLKTEASRTDLPIPEQVVDLLQAWRSLTPFNGHQDWVFASPFTKGRRPYWPGQFLKTRIQPIAVKAGFPKIGWHSFRHSLSAWGKEAGWSLEGVRTLMRHQQPPPRCTVLTRWKRSESFSNGLWTP
jgi:integrase